MSQVYVVSNQDGLFISKQKEWLDGRDAKLLFRCEHKDEAINMVFELSSRDIYLRAEAITVDLNEKKQPVVEVTVPISVPTIKDDDPAEYEAQDADASKPDSEVQAAGTLEQQPAGTPKLQLVTD